MPNRFCSKVTSADAQVDKNPASTVHELSAVFAAVRHLPEDEIERLIGLCEAPALLWCAEQLSMGAAEPFGMIA